MWRSNYQEDWERRKTYLIRSLFQDIPVLSPVPEDQESRYGADSPSNIPPSRPHSPLPPLIIEKIPNRHDHSPKFYEDLEKKMKKLYKKMFFNEDSSSVEDLIEMYGGDIPNIEDHFINIGGENASISTVKLHEHRSRQTSSSEQVSVRQDVFDKDVSKILSNGSSPSSKSQNLRDSNTFLDLNQVTTVVDVHRAPSSHEDIEHQEVQSPVLEYQQMGYNKIFALSEIQHEMCDEDQAVDSVNEERTETSGSTEEGDLNQNIELSHESIECMRRQREISPSLGSLHNDPITTPCSRHSSTNTPNAFHKRSSFGLLEENISSDVEESSVGTGSVTSQRFDFSNILSTSTPKGVENSETSNRSSSLKRLRSNSCDELEENTSIIISKRRKFENIAIQTSLTSESDADDAMDWNQIKKHFFVGVPRIYKLCPCNDHACSS